MGSPSPPAPRGAWSVYDATPALPTSPDDLMAEIDAAISRVEFSHATAELDAAVGRGSGDAGRADQYHRLGCKALSAGSFREALRCFKSALAWCPPEKRAAVAKLDSLIAFASQEAHKSDSPSLKQF